MSGFSATSFRPSNSLRQSLAHNLRFCLYLAFWGKQLGGKGAKRFVPDVTNFRWGGGGVGLCSRFTLVSLIWILEGPTRGIDD